MAAARALFINFILSFISRDLAILELKCPEMCCEKLDMNNKCIFPVDGSPWLRASFNYLFLFTCMHLFSVVDVTYAFHAEPYSASSVNNVILDQVGNIGQVKTPLQELAGDECRKCKCSVDVESESRITHAARKQRTVSVHPQPIPDISDACQTILQDFSVSIANFSSCLAMSARPITVCQDCINQYQEVTYWFQNISSDGGAGCNEELLNRDHLLVVQSLMRDAERFWNTARCPNCYNHDDQQTPRLCNDTLGFLQLYDEVNSCINRTETVIAGGNETKNESQVCQMCRDDYLKLNDYYENLNTIYNNRLCMDVMDGMNITRHLWSSTYQCTSIDVEGLPVLLCSLGFMLLPLIFYCANRFVASAKDTRLVQQKRMSFVQTSYSSASLQR